VSGGVVGPVVADAASLGRAASRVHYML
jgi:hypothetical protein